VAGAGESLERQKWQCAKGMVPGLLPCGVGVVGGAGRSGATCNGVHVQLCGGKEMRIHCTLYIVHCTLHMYLHNRRMYTALSRLSLCCVPCSSPVPCSTLDFGLWTF
jgi:hypothetical protein